MVSLSGVVSMVMGDFNAIMDAHEKTRLALSRISCMEFQMAMEATYLQMLDTVGAFHTLARHGVNGFVESKIGSYFLFRLRFGFLGFCCMYWFTSVAILS